MICPAFPDKRPYPDKEAALAAIRGFPNFEKRRSMNAYHCYGCGAYHVGTRKNYANRRRPR